jgi:hypothetical protein
MTYEQALDRIAYLESVVSVQGKTIIELRRREVPLSKPGYDWIMNLQYKVKSLSQRITEFESGEIYLRLNQEHKSQLAAKDGEIRKLRNELASARASHVTMNKNWGQTLEDTEKAYVKVLAKKEKEFKKMETRALNAERHVDKLKDRALEEKRKLYAALTEVVEEKGKVKKLTALINKDFTNSSVPSSMSMKPKKIVNNREKTGRRPGGQPGHAHHPRRKQEPTEIEYVPVPDEFHNTDIYVPTGRVIEKQLVELMLIPVVKSYWTLEYRNKTTGARVSAEFPEGLTDDVTYGSSIKAIALLFVNHCNVSHGKVSDIISDLTGGAVKPSVGFINKLTKEFSLKTQQEQGEAIRVLLLSSVMNIDFTGAKVNGSRSNVLVCATGDTTKYFPRKHKGFEGVKGSPIEIYMNILVHDHDKTFYNFGTAHQECLDHVLRYLKGSMLNEKNLQWNRSMRELIQEMIHFRKHLDIGDGKNPNEIDPERVEELVAKYDELLELAKTEYEYEPPSTYYKDGYNLYLKMSKYRAAHLLFLHDYRVPWTNSLAERKLRQFKRKQHQVMCFRSDEGLEYFCDTLGVLETLRAQGKNLYEAVTEIFSRPKPGQVKVAS